MDSIIRNTDEISNAIKEFNEAYALFMQKAKKLSELQIDFGEAGKSNPFGKDFYSELTAPVST